MTWTSWQATETEVQDLLGALEHFCACVRNEHGAIITPCPGHAMLANADERSRVLSHLVCVRRTFDRYWQREFCVDPPAAA